MRPGRGGESTPGEEVLWEALFLSRVHSFSLCPTDCVHAEMCVCVCVFSPVDNGPSLWLAVSLILDQPELDAFFGNTSVVCTSDTPSQWSQFDQDTQILKHCSPTLIPSFRALRTCNWKPLQLLSPSVVDPSHLPPWHHHPGMHCHTPNRNVSLLFEIHTDTWSPEGSSQSQGSPRLGTHKSTGVPWLFGSTSSTSAMKRY